MTDFRIGLTRDLLTSSGSPAFGEAALAALEGRPWEWLPDQISEITPEIAARYDALCVNSPRVAGLQCRAGRLQAPDRRPAWCRI